MAALLGSLGYKTRFKTVAADPSAPYAFSHVYIEIYQRKTGQWIALDSTVPQSFPGWQPPQIFRSKAWRTMGDAGTVANSQCHFETLSTVEADLCAQSPTRKRGTTYKQSSFRTLTGAANTSIGSPCSSRTCRIAACNASSFHRKRLLPPSVHRRRRVGSKRASLRRRVQ